VTFSLTPVRGVDLIDREKELDQLVSELSKPNSRIGFSITGIRRVGKTSILYETKKRLEQKGIIVIYVSVWKTLPDTLDSFMTYLFDETIHAFERKLSLKMKMTELAKMGTETLLSFLKHLKLSVEADDIVYTVSYVKGEEKDLAKATLHTFSLIDKLALKTKTKAVLIIDEFPSMTELKIGKKMVGSPIVKTIRTINEDYKKTALVISGSFIHTMQAVALSPNAPLYKQLINLEIKPLQKEAIADFIKKYLKKQPDQKTLEALFETTNGIPYNLQILGRELDYLQIKNLEVGTIQKATQSLIAREGDLHFKEYLHLMQSTEVKVAKIMAVFGVNGPKEIADQANMQLNEVTSLLGSLMDKGIVERVDRGQYAFTDSMFKVWLGQT
jgi:AAA+ ATPase superfamily predicted ATPase